MRSPPRKRDPRMVYVLQFTAAQLVADGVYDDHPLQRANLIAGVALYVASTSGWVTFARPDSPASAFRANLAKCGIGSN